MTLFDEDLALAWRGTAADILSRLERAQLEVLLAGLRGAMPPELDHSISDALCNDRWRYDDRWRAMSHAEMNRVPRYMRVRAALLIRELLRRDEEGREAKLDGWEDLQDRRWPTRVTHRYLGCTKCDWTLEAEAAARATGGEFLEAALARWSVCYAPRISERVLPLWEQKNLWEKTK